MQGVFLRTQAFAEESHPGLAIEANYAEAVLQFNAKDFPKTVEVLDSILQVEPKHIQALELKALSQRSLGKSLESISTYQALLAIKPLAEQAPYHFEIGVLYFREKKYRDAREHLKAAVDAKFNEGPAVFFLAQNEFESGFFKEADEYFTRSAGMSSELLPVELKIASHYYLGLIHSRSGYATGATHELLEAKESAQKFPNNKLAAEIGTAASAALAPYDSTQWFGNVSVLGEYDGNVSLLSSTAADAQVSSGKTTAKTQIVAGLGRVSSPMDTLQWVVSYRASTNKNFNKETREYEFFSNMPSLYVTYQSLAKTNLGFKVDGAYTFQNHVDPVTAAAQYRKYSLSGETGPYLRTELARKTNLTFEVFARPQHYYSDPDSGTSRRSGLALFGRVSMRRDTGSSWINPEGSVSYENNASDGTDYQSNTFGFSGSNQFKLSDTQAFTVNLDLLQSSYAQRLPVRSDFTINFRINWLKQMSAHWSLVGDLGYSNNTSNLPDLYSYKKPTASFGFSYTL